MDWSLVTAWKVFASLIAIILAVIGLSGVPGDIKQWQDWISLGVGKLDQNNMRWLLVLAAVMLLLLAWLPWGRWFGLGERQVAESYQGLAPIPGASRPRATPEELKEKKIEGRSFYAYELSRDETVSGMVRGREIVSCEIYGPAVLAPILPTEFLSCQFNFQYTHSLGDDKEKMALYWPKGVNEWQLGAIQLQHCTFSKCDFWGIGLAAAPSEIEAMKKQIEYRDMGQAR